MSRVSQYIFTGSGWQDENGPSVTVAASTRSAVSRDGLVLGQYKPNTETAGLVAGVTLAPVNTKMTYGQYGTASARIVVENKQFNDRVSVNGKYLTFKNCWFRGSASENIDCVTSTNANCEGIVFQDCLFYPQHPQWAVAAVRGGHHTTFSRCEVRGTIDGIAHTNSAGYSGPQALYVYGCWFHDMAYFSPDPGAAGGKYDNASHVDLIQLRGGGDFHFKGNNFDGRLDPNIGQSNTPSVDKPEYDSAGNPTGKILHITGNKYYPDMATTSVLMCSPPLAQINGLLMEHNWINGGAFSINMGSHTNATAITVRDNYWGRDMRLGTTATTIAQLPLPMSITSNTFGDDGSPANMRARG
jgi:hypothetical protein